MKLASFTSVNWPAVLSAVFAAFFSHSLSVPLGNGTLTASVGTTPVHLTPDAILHAAILAYGDQAATVQVGDIIVAFTPNVTTVAPNA